jgi:hypothetical protein
MWSTIRIVALGLALLALPPPAPAAEETPGWQFEVLPYAWLPGLFGTAEVKGRTADVDVTIGDVLTQLWHGDAFTLGGYFGARYDRFSLFADAYGGFLDAKARQRIQARFCCVEVDGTISTNPVLADVAVGYRIGEWPIAPWSRPFWLEVYLGTRIVHLGVTLDAQAGVSGGLQGSGRRVSGSYTTATPMVGLRWEVPVWEQVTLDFRGDLGGLPGGNRLNWSFLGDLRYWLDWSPWGTRPWLEAGYRMVGFNHDFGGGNDLALQLRGPLLGLGFAF